METYLLSLNPTTEQKASVLDEVDQVNRYSLPRLGMARLELIQQLNGVVKRGRGDYDVPRVDSWSRRDGYLVEMARRRAEVISQILYRSLDYSRVGNDSVGIIQLGLQT